MISPASSTTKTGRHDIAEILLKVTRSQTPFHTSYILKGHTLESVTTAKYLGITISKDELGHSYQ
jgi:hypothetical protein